MKLDEQPMDEESQDIERESKGFMGYAILGVSMFVLLVGIVVFIANRDKLNLNQQPKTTETTQMENSLSELALQQEQINSDLDKLITGSTLVSDELDIWEEYPVSEVPSESEQPSEKPSEESDVSTDGNHTLVVHADGKEEWLAISPYLPKNTYESTGFVSRDDRITYYVDSKVASYTGVDISKDQGYVDYNEVKKDGIDYVMIRLGVRGYGSGQLVEDECFADNIKRATDAGLDVGVYFYSQAVTEEEATEEADMVIKYLEGYQITYPVAYVMEHITNDTSRIDALTKEEKTRMARTFIDKIKNSGYNTVLYGNKEWILTQINYSAMTDCDIWLSQESSLPDYPYKFSMWQYSTAGSVEGIVGKANMNISFIDYSLK